jgi:hypothetical protein
MSTPASSLDRPPQQNEVPTSIQPELNDPAMQMAGQKEDPNSIASLSAKSQIQQGQAVADSRYDPKVEPSGSKAPFMDYSPGIAKDNIKTRIIFFIAGLLLIVFICWYVSPSNTFKGLQSLCGLGSLIKLPRLFRR